MSKQISNEDPEQLYTAKQAADFLSVTARTLQNWRTLKKGPRFIKFGPRGIRYKRNSLISFVETLEPHLNK